MTVMSIRIDEKNKKALKVISSIEGKTISGLVTEMIDDYISRNKDRMMKVAEREMQYEIMRISENSFSEWDNEEDEVYNDL